MDETLSPEARSTLVGHQDAERQLRARLDDGALSHGWILSGPRGLGKATLAFRTARALLDPAALVNAEDLTVAPDSRVFHLVAARAHPDLFVARCEWDEKKSRFETEISVEKIRKLIGFLNNTASGGGWRVAIIDSADNLNRNGANALLKVLEEPPKKTLIMLIAHAPGRLLATIRSRCRRLALRPAARIEIERFLEQEGAAKGEDARLIAEASCGRPGRALYLAAHDGIDAVACVDSFFLAASRGGDFGPIIAALSGRGDQAKWDLFKELVVEKLSAAARAQATGTPAPAPLDAMRIESLLEAVENLSRMSERGDALNVDRAQILFAMGRDLRDAFKRCAA